MNWCYRLFVFSGLLVLALATGCGDFFVSNDTLDTIAVSPSAALASVGQTVNFTASGKTVGGTTTDITSTATWSSSSNAVATINAGGMATAAAAGTTTISAGKDNKIGQATLTVTASKLQSISITPSNPSVLAGSGTQPFHAVGTFADGSTLDLTNLVQWSSSNTAVATINSFGQATLVAAGSTTITASITASGSTISGTTNLTVS